MCEVAAAPSHGDGLWGDVVNLVLSATQGLGDDMENVVGGEYSGYLQAQKRGEEGDCSSYHKSCPMSLFSYI